MPKVSIDIGSDSYKNTDEISTKNGVSPLLFDGYKDEAGSDIKRHGYQLFKNLGTKAKVDGQFWSKTHRNLYVVSGGVTFRVSEDGTALNLGLGLEVGKQVVFVEDATRVYMANGGSIYYAGASASPLTKMADEDAPTTVIGLSYTDTYLIAATSTKVHFSDIGDSLSWTANELFTPESLPDGIQSLQVAFRELVIFGNSSIDVYFNDGSNPFSRLDGAFIERGCISGDSVTRHGNIFYFLDDKKQVNTLTGRKLKIISGKINREIGSYNIVSDAIGNVITMFGKEFYLLQFPTEGQTWVYDIQLDIWTQWSFWSTASGQRLPFKMNSYAYAHAWDQHIIGDISNGKLYTWSDDIFTDDGEEIRFERITGHINHDTFSKKRSNNIFFKVKRGIDSTITTTREGKLLIKHRNDGKLWSNEKTVSLGYDGDTEIIAKLYRQGIYRTRQWSIVHSDPTPFRLGNPIEEDVDLLVS